VSGNGESPGRGADALLERLRAWNGRQLTLMEVCGTHTVAAARSGLRSLLPGSIRLVSGPGCPVCVTEVGYIDRALALAREPGVILATFGDLLRVPGSVRPTEPGTPATLEAARAAGADVRVVYSPLDALELAATHGDRQLVLLGVGFETTAPGLAASILSAADRGLDNFSVLLAAKAIPPAMEALVCAGELGLDGFLCPGHVSVIIGSRAYEPLARDHRVPCAVAGFEPVEILRGLVAIVDQVEAGEARVANCYPGAVTADGNPRARSVMERVFEPRDSRWRGLGRIPGSGLGIRDSYRAFDAAQRLPVEVPPPEEPVGCRCGEVLRGVLDPLECALFGAACTPERPQGACMVSSEGACAARFHYRSGDDR
jgi:hydrogenase expression/formation protein HypD